jgi:hypothetical protein
MERNPVAGVLKTLAIIMGVLFFIGGIIMGNSFATVGYYEKTFDWVSMLEVWFCGIITSALIYAIGVIVEQLDSLLDVQHEQLKLIKSISKHDTPEQPAVNYETSENAYTAERDQSRNLKNLSKNAELTPVGLGQGKCSLCDTRQSIFSTSCASCGAKFTAANVHYKQQDNTKKSAVLLPSYDSQGTCSLCGKDQPIGRKICWQCGATFEKDQD